MFTPSDERIYWLRVGDDFTFNDTTEIKTFSSVWKFGAHNEISISAAFANELPRRCIVACSNKDDIVLDVYGGSGTTMAVCEQLSRQCRMIEIEAKYCAVILQRLTDIGLSPVKVIND
jgi:DNA modification methylase